jgi:hypothetical protein
MLFFLDKGYNHLVVTHLIPCQAVNYAIAFLGHRKILTTTKGVHIYGNYWLEVKPLFTSPPNSKFLHSLSITSIFRRMYGVLNVDKRNN